MRVGQRIEEMSHGGSLPVVVRVKRKRELAPVDTIVVEAEETPAAKRRARDAALAAELDASSPARSGPDLSPKFARAPRRRTARAFGIQTLDERTAAGSSA